MQCTSCQSENRSVARYCANCGKSLEAVTPALAEDAPFMADQTEVEEIPVAAQNDPESIPEALDTELDKRIEHAESLSFPPEPINFSEEAVGENMAKLPPSSVESEVVPDEITADEVLMESSPEAMSNQEVVVIAGLAGSADLADEQQTVISYAETTPPEESLLLDSSEGAADLPVRAPGTKITERFEIVELLETEAGTNVYAALDLAMCPACRFPDNDPQDDFCIECGANRHDHGTPVQVILSESYLSESIGLQEGQTFINEDRIYQLTYTEEAVTEQSAVSDIPLVSLLLEVGCASHVGMVRELDEDSLFVFNAAGLYESLIDPIVGLFIVADGMGGHEGGEVASKLAVQKIVGRLLTNVILGRFTDAFPAPIDDVDAEIIGAIADANMAVIDLARESGNDMGCTVTMALIMQGVAHIANVGDSRTYILRQGRLQQITADHSLVASLVLAEIIKPDEIFAHPKRSVIYRSIGAKSTVEADIFVEPLTAGDTLLLCCDGLWEAIRDEGIEEVLLTNPNAQSACNEMVRRANQAGGEDNISVIIVKTQELAATNFLP